MAFLISIVGCLAIGLVGGVVLWLLGEKDWGGKYDGKDWSWKKIFTVTLLIILVGVLVCAEAIGIILFAIYEISIFKDGSWFGLIFGIYAMGGEIFIIGFLGQVVYERMGGSKTTRQVIFFCITIPIFLIMLCFFANGEFGRPLLIDFENFLDHFLKE